MAITTLSMVLTVFVLNLHHINDRPVPSWLQRTVFIYLARILGMCATASEAINKQKKSPSFFRRASVVVDAELGETKNQETGAHSNEGSKQQLSPQPQVQYVEVKTINSKPKQEDEKPEDHGKEWKRLAEIFDRLFFWLFLLAILISTLILFHPLTKSYMQQDGIA